MKKIKELPLIGKVLIIVLIIVLSGGLAYGLAGMGSDKADVQDYGNSDAKDEKISRDTYQNEVQGITDISSADSDGSDDVADRQGQENSAQPTYDRTAADREAAVRAEADRQTIADWEAQDKARQLASCEASKKVLIDGYQVYKDQIETRHVRTLSSISSNYASRGMTWSGGLQADIQAENTRYQNELEAYEANYQQKLSSFNC